MPSHRSSRKLALAVGLVLGLCGASQASMDLPVRFVHPGLDGAPVVVANPVNGTSWAVWAYRSLGEFDVAVSLRDARGLWSPPAFLGASDRLDQISPALTADAGGNLYLAFAVRQTGRIYLSVLPLGSDQWTSPSQVSLANERAASPQLLIVRDRLVLGYRVGPSVVLRDFPILGFGSHGVQDGPDVLPPLGTAPPIQSSAGDEGGGLPFPPLPSSPPLPTGR